MRQTHLHLRLHLHLQGEKRLIVAGLPHQHSSPAQTGGAHTARPGRSGRIHRRRAQRRPSESLPNARTGREHTERSTKAGRLARASGIEPHLRQKWQGGGLVFMPRRRVSSTADFASNSLASPSSVECRIDVSVQRKRWRRSCGRCQRPGFSHCGKKRGGGC